MIRTLRQMILTGAAAAVMMASPVQAEWLGGGVIHSPVGCTTHGWPSGPEMVRGRVRNTTEDGGATSTITIAFAVGGVNTYDLPGAIVQRNTFRMATSWSVWDRLYDLRAARPRIRVVQWAPNDTAAGNGATSRRGVFRIRNFNGEAGCTVDVTLALRRHA